MDRDVWLAEMALKDATITFCWMTCMSAVGVGANLVVEDLKLDHDMPIVLVAGALFAVLPAFLYLASWMGGACWNITSLMAFAYMGDSYTNRHTVVSILIRLMAQMVAAVWAAVFIIRMVPPELKHMVGGPTLQVDPFKGVLVEGILTYILILVSLMTMLRGPTNPRARQLISVVCTVMLVILGGAYTGPSMNPTNSRLQFALAVALCLKVALMAVIRMGSCKRTERIWGALCCVLVWALSWLSGSSEDNEVVVWANWQQRITSELHEQLVQEILQKGDYQRTDARRLQDLEFCLK